MQPYFIPGQFFHYSPVYELQFYNFPGYDMRVASNVFNSQEMSPRMAISSESFTNPAIQSPRTQKKSTSTREAERAALPPEEPDVIVHYRIIECPVEKLVEKASFSIFLKTLCKKMMYLKQITPQVESQERHIDYPVEKYVEKVLTGRGQIICLT